MEYFLVKELQNGVKRYLDKEGEFGLKSLAYPMPKWIANVVLRACFSYRNDFYIEEAR